LFNLCGNRTDNNRDIGIAGQLKFGLPAPDSIGNESRNLLTTTGWGPYINGATRYTMIAITITASTIYRIAFVTSMLMGISTS